MFPIEVLVFGSVSKDCALSEDRVCYSSAKLQDMHRFDFSGSITREQNVFTAQKTPLFIRTDVVNKLQACFPQNKILVQNTLISMRWRLRDKS